MTDPSSTPSPPPGRGPTDRVRRVVLEATEELLEEGGFARLTVDAIAERSGVGKATIYRWWNNRADVAMEALLEKRGAVGWFVEEGPAIDNLLRQLLMATDFLSGASGVVVAGVLGDAQHDPGLAAAFRLRFLDPLYELTHELLAAAVREGDVRADLDPDTLIDMITGPLYFRRLVTGAPLTADGTRSLLDAALRGARP